MSNDNAYEPLRVVATLRSAIMLDRWLPLDGILGATAIDDPDIRERARAARQHHFYQLNCRKYGREETDKWYHDSPKYGRIPPPVWHGHFLPLAVFGHGLEHGLWCYCSSYAAPVGEYEMDTVHLTKRIDWLAAHDYVRATDRKINVGKGEFLVKYMPYETIVVQALEWRVFGLRDEIQDILNVTFSIGKKRRRGYGFVQRWDVQPVNDEESVFTTAGELARPVPADLLEQMNVTGDFEHEFTTFRPPYWQTKYAAKCAVRGKRKCCAKMAK